MGQKIFNRKKYFLKGTSQAFLILRVYLILLFVMLVSGGIFYFLGNKNLSNELYQAHSTIKTTMQLLLPAIIFVNIAGLLAAVALVVGFTHSIAGPIYRLKNLSEKIAKGDLSINMKFRDSDTIKELADLINNITASLNSRVKDFNSSLSKLQGLSLQVNNIDKLSRNELVALRDAIVSISKELEDEIKKIKL